MTSQSLFRPRIEEIAQRKKIFSVVSVATQQGAARADLHNTRICDLKTATLYLIRARLYTWHTNLYVETRRLPLLTVGSSSSRQC